MTFSLNPRPSCIDSTCLNHYATSVHSSVTNPIKHDLNTLRKTFPTHGTVWLMSDVGRRSSAAARPGHAVTGPDINLDFPDAKLGCTTLLGSCNVAPDRRPTEKQVPAGKLAGFSALGTHKAGHSA